MRIDGVCMEKELYRFCVVCKGWRKKSEFGPYEKNEDGIRRQCGTCMLVQNLDYQKRHPHKMTARAAKRRALKLKRTPKWLSKSQQKEILSIYKKCREISERTGVKHEVDHIVPLRGRKICGLHVPWNLQILTKTDNAKKGNRYNEDT